MLQSFFDWWSAMDQYNQIFWVIALVASALFLFQVIISLIGLDGDLEAEFDEFDDGFSIISFRSIIAFLMFFGWGGVVSLYKGMNMPKSIMIASLTGFVAMLGVAYVFSLMLKMQESGTINLKSAVAKIAEVYLTIPSAKSGMGKIQISIDGKVMEFDAMTKHNTIPNGAKVRVLDILDDNVMLVEPIK